MSKKCFFCDTEVSDNARFCLKCGKLLADEPASASKHPPQQPSRKGLGILEKYCEQCRVIYSSSSKTCPECGSKLSWGLKINDGTNNIYDDDKEIEKVLQQNTKNTWLWTGIAAFLCIFILRPYIFPFLSAITTEVFSPQKAQFEIGGYTYHFNPSSKKLHLSAIGINNGKASVEISDIAFTVYGENGKIITVQKLDAVPSEVLPSNMAIVGKTVDLGNISSESEIIRVEVTPSYEKTYFLDKENYLVGFENLSVTPYYSPPNEISSGTDSISEIFSKSFLKGFNETFYEGHYKITGLIVNKSKHNIKEVRVSIAFLDKDKNLIGSSIVTLNETLSPEQKTAFEYTTDVIPIEDLDKKTQYLYAIGVISEKE